MKVLIDTQILIWFQNDSPKLNYDIQDLIRDEANEIWVSPASFFEIAIKHKTGKLPEVASSVQEFMAQARIDNFFVFGLDDRHIAAYNEIPFRKAPLDKDEHKDPFDRMILATALAENIPIVSADSKFVLYTDLVSLIPA
ncbi:type II toxin-antitoxin system VapC family toxin [Spirosoma litoris]